jgi:polyphosphate kinase
MSISGNNNDFFLQIKIANLGRKIKALQEEAAEARKSYERLPILMQSLLRWMDNQMKACQQPPRVRQV